MKKVFLSTLFLLLINNSFAKSGFYIGGNLQSVNNNLKIKLENNTGYTMRAEDNKDNFLAGINIGYKFNFIGKFYITPDFNYNFINKTFKMDKKIGKSFSDLKDEMSLNLKFGYDFNEKTSSFILVGTSIFRNSDFYLDCSTGLIEQADELSLNLGFGGEYGISDNLYLNVAILFKYYNGTSNCDRDDLMARLKTKEVTSNFVLGLNYYF